MKINSTNCARGSALFKKILLGGAAMAGAMATPAMAQDSANDEEIVVTATRRAQDILDVPYNISAVTGAQIEEARMRDSTELLRSVAGVSVVDRGERNGAVVNGVRIRGLNVDSAALGDYAVSAVSTVSTYVNDTPIFANFLLTDIARVEVLRGPQGTLYGSGALGGTVRYIMNAPELGEYGGHGQLSLSQVEGSEEAGWGGDLTINLPLGERAAFRGTIARADYPGVTDYVNLYELDASGAPSAPNGVLDPAASYTSREDADTVDIWFGRASLLVEPTDTIDLTLNYFHQSDEIGGRRGQTLGADGFGNPYQHADAGACAHAQGGPHRKVAINNTRPGLRRLLGCGAGDACAKPTSSLSSSVSLAITDIKEDKTTAIPMRSSKITFSRP